MKPASNWETQVENFTGRTVGTVLECILAALDYEQEAVVLATLRRAALNPELHCDDRRIYAILARFTDDELERLRVECCGPQLRVIEGGAQL